MKAIGIDPGRKGAIVCLDTETHTARYASLPYRTDNVIEFDRLSSWVSNDNCTVFLEDVHGRGKWGSASVFTFGCNYGQLRAWIVIQKRPHILIQPQRWQKIAHMGMNETDPKLNSYISFMRLNPNAKIRKTQDGIIDAFHIARYGIIYYLRNNNFMDDWEFLPYE
jgi:hypothetical protein